MKRFQFPLQAVLTLRLRAEHLALESYGRAVQAQKAAAEALGAAEEALADARRRWLNAMADGCPAARAAQMIEWSHVLHERRDLAGQALQRAELEAQQASQALLAARQQREAVEKHLEHQREKHQRAAEAGERKVLDDLVQHLDGQRLAATPPPETIWN